MYCIKCGVELADSERKCPLCSTVICHPEINTGNGIPPYPRNIKINDKVSHSGILFIITMLFLIPIIVSLICDFELNGKLGWSLHTVGGILLAYIIIALPMWFRHPNPVIFVSADFCAVGLFVWMISILTKGQWFLPFAFPLIGGVFIIVITVITLIRYVRRGHLYVFGGAFMAAGAFAMLIEFLSSITFGEFSMFIWSLYPLTACFIIGAMLMVIAICKPLKRSLSKVFFI